MRCRIHYRFIVLDYIGCASTDLRDQFCFERTNEMKYSRFAITKQRIFMQIHIAVEFCLEILTVLMKSKVLKDWICEWKWNLLKNWNFLLKGDMYPLCIFGCLKIVNLWRNDEETTFVLKSIFVYWCNHNSVCFSTSRLMKSTNFEFVLICSSNPLIQDIHGEMFMWSNNHVR